MIRFIPTFLIAIIFAISMLIQFNGLYGQDAHEYLRMMRSFGAHLKYQAAFPHTYFPILYPLMGFLLDQIFNDVMALQLVSVLAWAGCYYYLLKLHEVIYGKKTNLHVWLICFFLFSPYVLRFGILSMSDMMSTLMVLGSVYHVFHLRKTGSNADAALGLFFSTAAVSTRYATLIIVIIPVIIIFHSLITRKNLIGCLVGIFCAALPLLPDLFLRHRLAFLDLSKGIIDYSSNAYTWSPLNFFRSNFENPDGIQQYHQWNILAAVFNIVHPAFLFPGIVLLLFMRKQDVKSFEIRTLIILVVVYALYLAGLHYQNNRYLLQTFPFVLVILYPAFERLIRRIKAIHYVRASLFVTIILVQSALFIYSFQKIFMINYTEREIANSLKDYQGKKLYTCSITGALSSYNVQSQTVDLFYNKIDSVESDALLLFNYDEFSIQFENANPMLNWEFIQKETTLKTLRSYPLGWQLYSISKND